MLIMTVIWYKTIFRNNFITQFLSHMSIKNRIKYIWKSVDRFIKHFLSFKIIRKVEENGVTWGNQKIQKDFCIAINLRAHKEFLRNFSSISRTNPYNKIDAGLPKSTNQLKHYFLCANFLCANFSYTQLSFLLLQEDFDNFHLLLFKAFLCVFHNIYLRFLYTEKNFMKKYFY